LNFGKRGRAGGRGGRQETKKVIARGEGYKREGDTSVTVVTSNVSVSQCAGELLKRKGAPRETLTEYLATVCRPNIEAEELQSYDEANTEGWIHGKRERGERE
jgi:hypothetical protein